MKILFFGTPDFVIPVLQSLREHFELVGIVTTPDTIQGRKKILTPSPVKQFVLDKDLNIPIFTPEKLTQDIVEKVKKLQPDLFVVAAYGKIIPQALLDVPTYGSINVHPSLLPTYRGPSPIQTALLHGDNKSGVTLILMDKEVDHGPILTQEKVVIKPSDTFVTLHGKMFEKAAEMIISTITNFVDKKLIPYEQDHDKATFCEHITRESGYFDLQNPPTPEKIDNMVRAYYPWPTAWTKVKNKRGEEKIIKFLPEKTLQIEGGRPMPLKDFINGYPEMKAEILKLFQQ